MTTTVRPAASDAAWSALPADRATAVARAGTLPEALGALTDGQGALSAGLQQRLLRPAGGAAALLLPPDAGLRVLDLASGRSRLPQAVRSLGHSVTCADWVAPRLRLSLLLGEAEGAPDGVLLDADGALPFADASFDAVVVDLVEAASALGTALPRLLAEMRRVLSADGSVLARSANPLRGGSPRGLLAAAGGGLRAPWGEALLRAGGFADQQVWAAHPHVGARHALLPLETLAAHLTAAGRARSRAQAARLLLRRTAARAGAARWLVADYLVVARPVTRPRPAVRTTVVESLPPFAAGPRPQVRQLSDARVAVVGGDRFVKFPLSRFQHEAVVAEVERTERARATAYRPHVLPDARVERWGDVPYAVYPRIDASAGASPGAAQAALVGMLRSRPRPSAARLDGTALWRRAQSPRGRADVEDVGAGAVVARLAGRGAARVPVGPTHGDLHGDNVVLPVAGPPVLVDWNRFEPDNPVFLDPAYAAVRAHEQATGCSFAAALVAFARGGLGGPLAEDAGSLLGDLDLREAAALVLLDRVVSYAEPRRLNKPWTLAPLREATEAVMALTA